MNLIQKAIKKAKDFIDEKVMSRKEENIENALKQGCFEYLDKFEKYVKEDRKE